MTITLEAEGEKVEKTRVVRDVRTIDITAALLAVEAKESLARKLIEKGTYAEQAGHATRPIDRT